MDVNTRYRGLGLRMSLDKGLWDWHHLALSCSYCFCRRRCNCNQLVYFLFTLLEKFVEVNLMIELYLLAFLLMFELFLIALYAVLLKAFLVFKAFFFAFYLSVFHKLVNFIVQTDYITGHLLQNLFLTQLIVLLFILFVIFVTSGAVCSDVVIRRSLRWYCWPIPFNVEGFLWLFFSTVILVLHTGTVLKKEDTHVFLICSILELSDHSKHQRIYCIPTNNQYAFAKILVSLPSNPDGLYDSLRSPSDPEGLEGKDKLATVNTRIMHVAVQGRFPILIVSFQTNNVVVVR